MAVKGPAIECTVEVAERLNLKEEPGWTGFFTRDHAPQARWRPGQRIRKRVTERGDRHPIGTTGMVLGSVYVPEAGVGYFVEWDPSPLVATLVLPGKIEADISKESK